MSGNRERGESRRALGVDYALGDALAAYEEGVAKGLDLPLPKMS